jgi:hypothetical protein
MSSSSANALPQQQQQQQQYICQMTGQQPALTAVTAGLAHHTIMRLIDKQLDHLVRLRDQLRSGSTETPAAVSPPVISHGPTNSSEPQQPPRATSEPPVMQGGKFAGTTGEIMSGAALLHHEQSQEKLSHHHAAAHLLRQGRSSAAPGALQQNSCSNNQRVTQMSDAGSGGNLTQTLVADADAADNSLACSVLQQQEEEELRQCAAVINVAQHKLQQLLTLRQLQAQLQAELLQLLPLAKE